jgi:energy-coupling factor transport system ATP-binding protein
VVARRRTRGRPLLEAENLRYRYPGEKGFELKVERLAIPRGGTLAVVGDNGSGKSTLARLLCGLLTPDSGEVRVAEGSASAAADPAVLSRFTAYVFQDPDLQIFLPTVAEELGYGLRLQGLPAPAVAAHVADTATLFGLTRLQSPPALLSYGARKRLQSAVYYLLDKPLLIFDEGDSGLSAAEFLRLVGLFKGPGRGILVITHDLGLAGLLADRVVRLEKGKLA